jgi:hypothetical protein
VCPSRSWLTAVLPAIGGAARNQTEEDSNNCEQRARAESSDAGSGGLVNAGGSFGSGPTQGIWVCRSRIGVVAVADAGSGVCGFIILCEAVLALGGTRTKRVEARQ